MVDIALAEVEAPAQPVGVADDFWRGSVLFMGAQYQILSMRPVTLSVPSLSFSPASGTWLKAAISLRGGGGCIPSKANFYLKWTPSGSEVGNRLSGRQGDHVTSESILRYPL